MKTGTVGVSIIGAGYWGPNFIRNFSILSKANLRYICDLDKKKLQHIKRLYPHVMITTSIQDILKDKQTDAVVIATPVRTHYALAKMILEGNKHVLVEKPMTTSVSDAKELVALAKKKKRILCVDHTFIYTPAVQKMKQLVKKNELGELFYFDSVRANLGLFQHDTNVLWDLATHDLAIMDYLIEKDPLDIIALGASHIRKDMHNIVYVTIRYPGNLLGHIHVNWLAPVKLRLTLLSGYHKMIAYNDLEPVEKIKIYDRSITYKQNLENMNLSRYQYRVGDIHSPRLDDIEALHVLCEHFLQCILENKIPMTDGHAGLKIVQMLETAEKSLQNGGKPIPFRIGTSPI